MAASELQISVHCSIKSAAASKTCFVSSSSAVHLINRRSHQALFGPPLPSVHTPLRTRQRKQAIRPCSFFLTETSGSTDFQSFILFMGAFTAASASLVFGLKVTQRSSDLERRRLCVLRDEFTRHRRMHQSPQTELAVEILLCANCERHFLP